MSDTYRPPQTGETLTYLIVKHGELTSFQSTVTSGEGKRAYNHSILHDLHEFVIHGARSPITSFYGAPGFEKRFTPNGHASILSLNHAVFLWCRPQDEAAARSLVLRAYRDCMLANLAATQELADQIQRRIDAAAKITNEVPT